MQPSNHLRLKIQLLNMEFDPQSHLHLGEHDVIHLWKKIIKQLPEVERKLHTSPELIRRVSYANKFH